MSISDAIAPHLPYLRRFARALTGSQESGDSYVVATLESLIAAPQGFSPQPDVRAALYGRFLKIWNSVAENLRADHSVGGLYGDATDRNLDSITPVARQAFLLTAVEGFTAEQAAAILGKSQPSVEALISQAGREIAEQVATNILIIEDEPLIAMDLEALVQGLGHQVGAIARTHKDAVAKAKARPPGMVLADIQLADGSSGLEAVNEILTEFQMPVIFITAFPERLLTGARPEPTFLITKPFETHTVQAMISQALFLGTRSQSAPVISGKSRSLPARA